MISTRWLKERRPHWQRLEQLLDQSARAGLKALSHEDLRELGLLYRQAATDLATLRQDPGSSAFAEALNHVLARAHHRLYAAERTQPVAFVVAFFREYPLVFRRNRMHCLIAAAVFALGALCGAVLTFMDPEVKLQVLGPAMVDTINRGEMWTHSIVAIKPIASSGIMTNNISVSFMAFAMGITAGLGTLYMMLFNGVLIGVLGVACWYGGLSLSLWSFVVGHGSIEIPAILLAGGAGLRLAQGLLFPGVLPRRLSLARAGGEAVRLALGCVPILIVAGIVEAFVSPTDLAIPLKFAIGASLFSLLAAWLLLPPPHRAPTID